MGSVFEALAFAYRTSLVDAIHNSPFFLVHGRDARLPSDVLWGPEQEITNDENDYGIVLTSNLRRAFELARATQIETDVRRKKYYDSRAKLRRHFDGPYLVRCRLSDVTYELVHLDTQKSTMAHVQRIVRYYPPDDFRLRSSTQALSYDTANLTNANDKGPTSDGSLTANMSEPVLPRDGAGPHYASSISVEDRRGDQGAEVAFATGAPPCDDTSADFVSDQSCSKDGESAATSDEEDLNATEAEAQVTQYLRPTPTITHTYKSSRLQRRNVGTLPSRFRDGFVASLTY